jgi:hypothetical protein
VKINITPAASDYYIYELPVKTVFTADDQGTDEVRTYIKAESRWSFAYEQDNRLGGEAYCLETGRITRFLRTQHTASILGMATVEQSNPPTKETT